MERENAVAGIALDRNGGAVFSREIGSMTAEAPREIGMSAVIGISAPGHPHVRKDISPIDRGELRARAFDRGSLSVEDRGMIPAEELLE